MFLKTLYFYNGARFVLYLQNKIYGILNKTKMFNILFALKLIFGCTLLQLTTERVYTSEETNGLS